MSSFEYSRFQMNWRLLNVLKFNRDETCIVQANKTFEMCFVSKIWNIKKDYEESNPYASMGDKGAK